MLLCNVIVYESDGQVIVAAIRPTVAMQMIDNLDLNRIARDIERRLKEAFESMQPVEVSRSGGAGASMHSTVCSCRLE